MYRVIAFTVKPRISADTRYRILQYIPLANRDHIEVDHFSLMTDRFFRWQLQNSHFLQRIVLLTWLLLLRLWQVLVRAPKYDAVWISREMAPIGPPVLERLIVWRCHRVILDVDDALHVADKEGSRAISRIARDHGKYARMAASYSAVVCGNVFLAEFYRSHGAEVHVVPTVVDPDDYAAVRPSPSAIVRIGWIGTPLNRHHVELVGTALEALARERDFELVLVGIDDPFNWKVASTTYLRWTLSDELKFFERFDIGIMPLKDSLFARGKCAFKLVQYMAAGIPVVASPVGANSDLVIDGSVGFLAATDDEWIAALRRLIDDAELRWRMGERGRELIRCSYSVHSAWQAYHAILTGEGSTPSL